jgi:hypothetical protein
MEILFIANLILALLLPLAEPIYFTRYFKLSWLNPLTLAQTWLIPFNLLAMLPGPIIFLDKGLLNPYYQYALAVQNVHFLAHFITIVLLVRLFTKRRAMAQLAERINEMTGPARPARMLICSGIFFAAYVFSFLLLATPFGIGHWLANPRAGYQIGRTGQGEWFALAITFLSVSIVLFTLYVRRNSTILWLTPIYLASVYILGSKGLIINFAVFVLIALAIRHYRYLKGVTVVILFVSLALALSNFASLNEANLGVETFANYADYFVNAAHYYEAYQSGSVPLYHGEIALTNFWALVPRALVPDKPHVYGMMTIDEIFYPGSADIGSTPTFQTVDYFADFGWLQVILSGIFGPQTLGGAFLYAMVLSRLGRLNIRTGVPHTRMLLYLFLWLAAPMFLFFFDFPLDMILFGLIVLIVEVANRLRLVSPQAEEPGALAERPAS